MKMLNNHPTSLLPSVVYSDRAHLPEIALNMQNYHTINVFSTHNVWYALWLKWWLKDSMYQGLSVCQFLQDFYKALAYNPVKICLRTRNSFWTFKVDI